MFCIDFTNPIAEASIWIDAPSRAWHEGFLQLCFAFDFGVEAVEQVNVRLAKDMACRLLAVPIASLNELAKITAAALAAIAVSLIKAPASGHAGCLQSADRGIS